MTSPLERAARALAERHHQPLFDRGDSSLSPSQYADQYWRDYVEQARAVIEAIREPSGEMLNEAMRGPGKPTHTLSSGLWVRMVDALLAEGA